MWNTKGQFQKRSSDMDQPLYTQQMLINYYCTVCDTSFVNKLIIQLIINTSNYLKQPIDVNEQFTIVFKARQAVKYNFY